MLAVLGHQPAQASLNFGAASLHNHTKQFLMVHVPHPTPAPSMILVSSKQNKHPPNLAVLCPLIIQPSIRMEVALFTASISSQLLLSASRVKNAILTGRSALISSEFKHFIYDF